MKQLSQKYLEYLREAFTYLSSDKGRIFSPYSSIPLIILVFTISISHNVTTYVLGITFTICMLITAYSSSKNYNRVDMASVVKSSLMIVLIVFIISMPLIFLRKFEPAYMFITRVLAASLTFMILSQIIGWWNIIRGLELIKTPRIVTEMIYQTIKFIPLFITETLKLIAAREARILCRKNISSIWRALSSIVGDIIIKSYYRSTMFNMALNARTLSNKRIMIWKRVKPTLYDISLIIFTALILLLEVAARI